MRLTDVGTILATVVGMVAFLSFLFYWFSGWRDLRKTYGVGKLHTTKSWVLQSASIVAPWSLFGYFGTFRNCLIFGYTEHGVYMASIFPLSLVNKPILIPWEDAVLTRIDGYCLSGLKSPEVLIGIPQTVFYGLEASGRVRHVDGLGELLV